MAAHGVCSDPWFHAYPYFVHARNSFLLKLKELGMPFIFMHSSNLIDLSVSVIFEYFVANAPAPCWCIYPERAEDGKSCAALEDSEQEGGEETAQSQLATRKHLVTIMCIPKQVF